RGNSGIKRARFIRESSNFRPGCGSCSEEFGVYLIASGRMCVAGLNTQNVHRVAKAFAAVM
ncbi:hypothetical protein, partial [Escherichia coli]|uniref:hypothetical protein n=1 Tax=Escherichia coli TaxID=562 RepID=UPI003CEE9B74